MYLPGCVLKNICSENYLQILSKRMRWTLLTVRPLYWTLLTVRLYLCTPLEDVSEVGKLLFS